MRSRDPWVVSFSGSIDRCPICGEIDRAFERAAATAADALGVRFGRVDATAEGVDIEALSAVARLTTIPSVQAYPTYATLNPYDARRSVKMPKTFEIARPDGTVRATRVKDFVAFAEEALPTHLVERASAKEDARVRDAGTIRIGASEGVPTAVVVTNKKTTSALLKSIAHALEGRVRFLEATYDEGEDAPRLPGVADDAGAPPRLVVYPADASAAPIPFESDSMKRDAVLAFLTEHAGPEVELKMETIDTSKKRTGTNGDGSSSSDSSDDRAFESTSLLKPARASEYDGIVSSDHKRMKMVAFTKSGEACEKIVDALPTSLKDLAGVMDLHEIIVRDHDASASALTTKLELFRGEATNRCAELVFLPSVDDEDDSRDAVTFTPTGEGVDGYSAKSVRRFILDHVPDLTISVTAETMDSSLFGVAATAPKVLLFAAEDDAASRDVLHVMSATHREFVFGVTSDENEALTSQFQVTKRPALVVVYREKAAAGEPDGSMRMAIQKFPPEVALEQPMVNMWLAQLRTHILGVDTDAVVSMPKTVDASSALDDECAAKGGLCVIAFVKGDAAAEKKTVHAVAKSLYGKPFHFAIVDPTTQRSFAETFDVKNPVDYPTVTVMATRTLRFATHKGAFDAEQVTTFCEDVLGGKVKTWRFQEMPKLVEGGEKVEEIVEEDVVEEEFDLSDIMGEEVEGDAALSREELAARAEEELAKQQAEEAARLEEEAKKKAAKAKKKRRRNKKKKAKTEL